MSAGRRERVETLPAFRFKEVINVNVNEWREYRKHKIKEWIECIILWLAVIAGIAVMIAFPYMVAISDLPDWFKFWLLR